MESMKFEFKLDTITKKAFMIGNIGIEEVEIFIGDAGFTFISRLATGAVQTTTINRDGHAVHSRNTILAGELIASQYFGRCAPE